MSALPPFEYNVTIAWGHCDPAGIIYYPNYFRWFDAAFHALLAKRGLDQRILKDELGTFGTGLIDAGAQFKAPVTYGDELALSVTIDEWRNRAFRVGYLGTANDRTIVTGYEVRGLFMADADTGKLSAAPIAPLKALIEAAGPDGRLKPSRLRGSH